jgi:uncharacterized membrane protein
MDTSYNRIAGRSVERLAALSDGVFAVAMTLLALDLRAPLVEAIHSEQDLWIALSQLGPRLLMYVITFMTLGIFWIGQQTQLNHFARSDRALSWIHILFLFAVSMTPFSTTLVAQFIAYRAAVLVYWANLAVLGLALYFSWICASRGGLLKADVTPAVSHAIKRRITSAQALYAVAAALCAFHTRWSIGVILLLQLNYALNPWAALRRKKSS